MEKLIKRIAELIEESGKTDAEISNDTGIGIQTIKAIRAGTYKRPWTATVFALVKYFGVSDEEFKSLVGE